jgi:dihydrofolate synthase/folylpolyglutamate synthase
MVNLAVLAQRERVGIKRGLDNIRSLLAALGHPEQAYPVVLIGGTNGKGSTGAFLAHACRASGLRVGWATSPHLVDVTERVWLDGAPISAEQLDHCLGKVLAAEQGLALEATFFELVIAATYLAFREADVELALVEVGLGGRWDATNAADPVLSVLTNVALDHQAYLGHSLEAIAREKLCIARSGRPIVLGPGLSPEWLSPLRECDPRLVTAPAILDGVELCWDHSIVQGHRIGLAGPHQIENLAVAREALHQLRNLGFNLPDEAVWRGLETVRWPGRLWKVPGLSEVWLDGAHNPHGARALAAHARACGVRPHLFFGAMKDKDVADMAAALQGMNPLSLTFVRGAQERYAEGEQLTEAWGTAVEVLDLRETTARLREPSDAPRLVAGSLYLLGDLLRELGINP